MLTDFKAFLLKQNVMSLAIAVVIGTALNTLVKALVDDFIMPVVAAFGPGSDWKTATWDVGRVQFGVGDFLAALLNFVIIGFVAWRLSKLFIADVPTRTCQFCRMAVDLGATRCPHCTSDLSTRAA
jgi:large conductance mechanosensitive channel